ncbi:MAG: cysteine desulfurase family protein [Candidatus Omnitrophica bacterium]|jgi:cysteine desulfurase|nr:cysteine desulfurase family protein [Candidatus Omnitrophota bacterium]
MKDRNVYLDNNATTPLHPEVKKAISGLFDIYGNASSLHFFGRQAKSAIETARADMASFINADPDEIIFVGSGSEANNTVLNMLSCCSALCSSKYGGKRQIIVSDIEHPCVIETSKCMGQKGMTVARAGVQRSGKIDIGRLKDMINENTVLVSIMMANNEIGTIQDIKSISDITHRNGALLHTDAVQAVGKLPVDVKELGVDFLSFSAHKIYGPKGIGALYARSKAPFCPFIRGGHQEKGRRAGTENTIGIIGMAAAIACRRNEMAQEARRLTRLKQRLKDFIKDNIDDISFNGHPEDCLPGTLNVSFKAAEGEAVMLYLDMEGIAVSTGSACASGSLEPSHVLLAIGMEAEDAHGAIRFSLGRETTDEDIDYVIERLPAVIKKVRGMSSSYFKKG